MVQAILRAKFLDGKAHWPFRVDAIVLLPDHLHTIWSLPDGDQHYPRRWGWIKKEFVKDWLACGGSEQVVSRSRQRRRRRGVWQRRYWEQLLRDEGDFERHFDYIHYNPVKHGLVARPRDWPFTSFHRWVSQGIYPPDWGCEPDRPMVFDDLDETAME